MRASRVDRFSKSDVIVSPSILSANFARLGEQVTFQLQCLAIQSRLVSVLSCCVPDRTINTISHLFVA